MPNLRSAKKRLRQNERCAEVNKRVKSRVKSSRRRFLEAVAAGEDSAKQAAFSGYCSALDKAAKSGVIKKNNAIRNKTRAAKILRNGIVEPARKKHRRQTEATETAENTTEATEATSATAEAATDAAETSAAPEAGDAADDAAE